MKPVPTLAAIHAAELRLIQSRRNVRQGVARTRSALREAVTRPSTLVLVAVAAGVSAFWVSHRPHSSVKSLLISVNSKIRGASRHLVRTFVSVYGARLLAFSLQSGATACPQKNELQR